MDTGKILFYLFFLSGDAVTVACGMPKASKDLTTSPNPEADELQMKDVSPVDTAETDFQAETPAEEPDPNLGLSDDEYDSALLRALNNLNEDNLTRDFDLGDFTFTLKQMPFTKQMMISLNVKDNKVVKVLFGYDSYEKLLDDLKDTNPALGFQALEILQGLALMRHVTQKITLRRTGQSLGKLTLLDLVKKNALLPLDILTLHNQYDEWSNTFRIKISEAKN